MSDFQFSRIFGLKNDLQEKQRPRCSVWPSLQQQCSQEDVFDLLLWPFKLWGLLPLPWVLKTFKHRSTATERCGCTLQSPNTQALPRLQSPLTPQTRVSVLGTGHPTLYFQVFISFCFVYSFLFLFLFFCFSFSFFSPEKNPNPITHSRINRRKKRKPKRSFEKRRSYPQRNHLSLFHKKRRYPNSSCCGNRSCGRSNPFRRYLFFSFSLPPLLWLDFFFELRSFPPLCFFFSSIYEMIKKISYFSPQKHAKSPKTPKKK